MELKLRHEDHYQNLDHLSEEDSQHAAGRGLKNQVFYLSLWERWPPYPYSKIRLG